jgi:two-component system cell cycle response regulator
MIEAKTPSPTLAAAHTGNSYGHVNATEFVIDDSPFTHELVNGHFRSESIELRHATDPMKGLKMAKNDPPDLILLDLDMPEMNGDEVIVKLKADAATFDIPIIFLTANEKLETKVRCFDLGATDYIMKPFHGPELRARSRAALRTKRLQDMLKARARLDGLTGLWNRSYFDERVTALVGASDRYQRTSSVILFDIDHFKRCNDNHGHPFGDVVLTKLADCLRKQLRTSDTACRYGGEEFVVLLDGTDLKGSLLVAERIRRAVETLLLTTPNGEPYTVTASFGVASTEQFPTALSVAGIVKDADDALYKAKKAGRNNVQVAVGEQASAVREQASALSA